MKRQDLRPGVVYVLGKMRTWGGPHADSLVVLHPDMRPFERQDVSQRGGDARLFIPSDQAPSYGSSWGPLSTGGSMTRDRHRGLLAYRYDLRDGDGRRRAPTAIDVRAALLAAEASFTKLGPLPESAQFAGVPRGPIITVAPRELCATAEDWIKAHREHIEHRQRADDTYREQVAARQAADRRIAEHATAAGLRQPAHDRDRITVSAAWLADLLGSWAALREMAGGAEVVDRG